ncbi:MAG: DUF3604 domain-containing protein [Acidobacteria bacterium]|nr:DUF3604 domain-containing protein [Acidobacteriota bacterium]
MSSISRTGRLIAVVILVAAVVFLIQQGQLMRAQKKDYLSRELRGRVEKLKVEAAAPSETPAVLVGRLQTLWEWVNAWALTGGKVPVDIPAGIATWFRLLRNAEPNIAAAQFRPISDQITRYTHEFKLLDETPDALGKLALSKPGPYRSGDYVTFEQTWTVGGLPMAEGGGLLLTVGRGSSPQVTDAAGDDFVTIRSSNPAARFEVEKDWGQWTGFITRQTLNFRLRGASLKKGDTVTIRYGDTSRGSKGVKLQPASNDQVFFPIHLDMEGKGFPMTPPWPSVVVLGAAEIQYVNAVAPSVVRTGESFALAVRSEDRVKNLSSATTPEYQVLLNNQPLKNISAGSPAMNVLAGLKIDKPGVYRFQIRSTDGKLSGQSNPILVEDSPSNRIYWGETHGHSGFSEGYGSADGYFRFGRDVARLDFLTLSEHDLWMDDFEWKTMQEATRRYLSPGKFTTILGYEWTGSNPIGGHHNVFFSSTEARRAPLQETVDLDELYKKLRSLHDPKEVLIIPHAHQSGDWNRNDADMERLAEIQSGHGTFEYFGNKYLQNGFEVGFVGASDNHNGHPGYSGMGNRQLGGLAAVMAPRNTSEEVFKGLRNRRTYATTGERIILDVDLNGVKMGQRQAGANERKLRARVHGTEPIDTIDVIKNGKVVYSRRYLETSIQPRVWVQVKLEAPAEVFNGHKNPRQARIWRGSIEVKGARLVGFKEPWFAQPQSYRFARNAQNPNRLDYQLNTRGRGVAMMLELEGADIATELTVQSAATREPDPTDGTTPDMMDRPVADIPAVRHVVRLAELKQGMITFEQVIVQNIDTVQIQLVPGDGALDREFTWADLNQPRDGDYYYLRVTQVDGSMAWTSPFWIGGQARRYTPPAK